MKPRKVVPLAWALALGVTAALATPADATPPSTYNAITSTTAIAKPSVTDSGLFDLNLTDCPTHTAGYIFTPTDFYCPIVRVTDPNTGSGHAFFGPGSWLLKGWNTNSSRFYIQNDGASKFVYNFNTTTMACTQISGTYDDLTEWDPYSPYYCWGEHGPAVVKWDFATETPTSSTVVDFSQYITGLTGLYETHVSDGNNDGGSGPPMLAVSAPNGDQGTQHYAFWYDTGTNTGLIYDTVAGTITNTSGKVLVTGLTETFYMHQISITRDGRYVLLAIQGNPITGTANGPLIWDTTANTVTALANYTNGGHQALGFGEMLNDVYDHANTYWWYRQVDTLTHIQNPISLVTNATVANMLGYDDHPCWNQVQGGTTYMPMFSATIQAGGTYNQSPPAWGDEILGITTTDRSGAGTNTVYRFAHHRSTITAHPSNDDYYANAWANISQDGNWAMFQSNWEETLGTRTSGSSTYYRDDVFIVKLTQSAH